MLDDDQISIMDAIADHRSSSNSQGVMILAHRQKLSEIDLLSPLHRLDRLTGSDTAEYLNRQLTHHRGFRSLIPGKIIGIQNLNRPGQMWRSANRSTLFQSLEVAMNGDLRHSKGLGDLLQGWRGITLLEKALEKLHDFHLAIGVVHAQPPDLSSLFLVIDSQAPVKNITAIDKIPATIHN